jgi:hypothetical protein
MQQVVRDSENKVYDGVPITPTLTITLLRGNPENMSEPLMTSLTTMPVTNSPAQLSRAFLNFVSLDAGENYTAEELNQLTFIVTTIHQRLYKRQRSQ